MKDITISVQRTRWLNNGGIYTWARLHKIDFFIQPTTNITSTYYHKFILCRIMSFENYLNMKNHILNVAW